MVAASGHGHECSGLAVCTCLVHASLIHIPTNAFTPDSRQEPYDIVRQVRICAGGGWKQPSLPRCSNPRRQSMICVPFFPPLQTSRRELPATLQRVSQTGRALHFSPAERHGFSPPFTQTATRQPSACKSLKVLVRCTGIEGPENHSRIATE